MCIFTIYIFFIQYMSKQNVGSQSYVAVKKKRTDFVKKKQ